MKINIVSPGRFHVLDLARELHNVGHDVKFYSFVPDRRAKKYGLPRKCNASLFLFMLPFIALSKVSRRFHNFGVKIQDYLTGMLMRECDVLIAMSGNYLYTLKCGRKQGAIIILERGSKHILDQKQILESIPSNFGKKPVPEMNVKRELAGYELSDYISIAATHVKETFLKRGFPEKKLFVNPYGVDLTDFYKIRCEKPYDVIMVGGWTYRKGADLLIDAIKNLNLKLLHVGAIGDIGFPKDEFFHHVDPVDQKELVKYYNSARIFVLPSREEGMALVQMQAFACGLPIVCSKNTGGIEIANVTGAKDRIFEMEKYSVECLMDKILDALNYHTNDKSSEIKLENLSWEAYGRRYDDFLENIYNG